MEYLLHTLARVPENCVWELTNQCNLRCIHCESSSGTRQFDELTTDECLSLCKDLAELGTRTVHLSGGEPLMRRDWATIASRLVGLGISVQLITNGLMICNRILEQCKRVGINRIAISIDGTMPVHDSIRLYPRNTEKVSAFRKAYEAVVLAKLHGFTVMVITHINGRNLNELPQLYELLRLVPVDGWQLQLGSPLGRMKHTEPGYLISPDQLPGIAQFIAQRQQVAFPITVTDDIGYYTDHELALRKSDDAHYPFWTGCYAGIRSMAITCDGSVKGCPSMSAAQVEGNIRKRPLSEIWNDPNLFGYNRKWDARRLEGFCKTCEFRHLCRGGCTSFALSTTGSMYQNAHCLYQVSMISKKGGP